MTLVYNNILALHIVLAVKILHINETISGVEFRSSLDFIIVPETGEYTSLAAFTDSTTAYTFTVTVSDQYQSAATSKEFTLNINIPYTTIKYGNMTGHSTSLIDQNIFYNIAQD